MQHPVLLVALNSRFSHTSLALRSLERYIEIHWPRSPRIELLEATIHEPVLRLLRRLAEKPARIFAFSTYIWNISQVRSLSRQLRQVRPDAWIIWGGPEAGSAAERWLNEEPAVDLIIRGEGEAALLGLLRQMEAGGWPVRGALPPADLAAVPGLSWRDDSRQVVMNPETELLAPEAWPFPYRTDDLARNRERILYYESSRGCPFRCSYCLSARDQRLRLRPLEQTLAEIDQLIAARVRLVKFVDRTFNCQPGRALAIWQHLIRRWQDNPYITRFHFEIAGDLLDDAAVDCLNTAPPGLVQLEIGVQSIHPHVLSAISRSCDLGRLSRQVGRLRRSERVHLHLDLIAGLPGETMEQLAASFDYVMALRPHHFQLGFLKVLPGTPLAEQAGRLGFIWQDEPPYEILASDQLGFSQLGHLKDIADLLDGYWNSDLLTPALSWLAACWPRSWQFFSDWAVWQRRVGGFSRTLSPADRCRLLWQFSKASRSELAGATWLADAWLDLLRTAYILSGQKDQPAWLGFWENSACPELAGLIRIYKQTFKASWPRIRRWRVDRIRFDYQQLRQTGRLFPADQPLFYDLSGPRPHLLHAPE